MTVNQLAYLNYEELKRANRAREIEANRANTVDEAERNRHNLATETVQVGTLDESRRHNFVSEVISRDSLDESVRSHLANESIQNRNLDETHRANLERERLSGMQNATTLALGLNQQQESERHNKAAEQLTERSNETQQTRVSNDYSLGLANVDVKKAELDESVRHNTRTERQTDVHNLIDIGNSMVNVINSMHQNASRGIDSLSRLFGTALNGVRVFK